MFSFLFSYLYVCSRAVFRCGLPISGGRPCASLTRMPVGEEERIKAFVTVSQELYALLEGTYPGLSQQEMIWAAVGRPVVPGEAQAV